jgi:hypothetical protein
MTHMPFEFYPFHHFQILVFQFARTFKTFNYIGEATICHGRLSKEESPKSGSESMFAPKLSSNPLMIGSCLVSLPLESTQLFKSYGFGLFSPAISGSEGVVPPEFGSSTAERRF